MFDINVRILEFCEVNNLRQKDLVQLGCGTKQTTSFIFNMRQKAGSDFLSVLIKKFPTLNARWLLTGEGEMLDVVEPKSKYEKPAKTFSGPDCIEKERTIEAQNKTIETLEKLVEALEGNNKKGNGTLG